MRVAFDIEANGLLDTVTDIHSLVIEDIDTGSILSCTDNGYGYAPVKEGLDLLVNAELRIAHNGIGFDDPCLLKLYPKLPLVRNRIHDTLVLAKLVSHDLMQTDYIGGKVPRNMLGSHSLEAWGHRLGVKKDTFGHTADWSTWTQEMQTYCEQDVKVLVALYKYLEGKFNIAGQSAIQLEHRFAQIIHGMESFGAPFNMTGALVLSNDIQKAIDQKSAEISAMVPPWVEKRVFTPKVNNAKRGYVKGIPQEIFSTKPFNPMSRTQILRLLAEKYRYKPASVTDKGNPKIDGDTLAALPYEEAKLIAPLLELQKVQSQLSSGVEGWTKHAKKRVFNGEDRYFIHGRMNTLGARTHRCTHSSPNLGQVPSPRALFGKECRQLFEAPTGYKFVGCDASGIELRNLAHYLAMYDNGAYTTVILSGDVHTKNQNDAGLPTRDNAKTFIYALNYGAGDEKLGSIVAPHDAPSTKKAKGAQLRNKFLSNNRAFSRLMEDVKATHNRRGNIKALDGRYLLSTSAHSALNTLLQSAGAVIMKRATVILWDELERLGYDKDVHLILHVHDEYQHIVRDVDGLPEKVGQLAKEAIVKAGEFYKFRCPLDGEYKIGDNWYDCH